MNKSFSIFLLLLATPLASADQPIAPDNKDIQILGTKYVTMTSNGLQFQRHSDALLKMPNKESGINPAKAANTSGIVIAFKTDSSKVSAKFRILSSSYMGSSFAIFENGNLLTQLTPPKKEQEVALEFDSKSKATSLFEITLPSFSNVEFLGLDLDDGAQLDANPNLQNKTYVAIGDSISHGQGQKGATHTTWPFLLSRKLNMEVFNLAVGGGKVSVPIGAMLADWTQIDLITILCGYNDLHFDRKSPEDYAKRYNELLDAIRKNHPKTRIYCITPLFTKKDKSEKTGHTIEEFRKALAEVVRQRKTSDSNLHLIHGEHITSEKNLQEDRPQDPVHLGVEGASLFTEALAPLVRD